MNDCVELSKQLARRVSDELAIPTFLYGAAATSQIEVYYLIWRKGQYEGFRQRLENGGPYLPDFWATRME